MEQNRTKESEQPNPTHVQIKCALPFALCAEGDYEINLDPHVVAASLHCVKQQCIDSRVGIESGDFDLDEDRCGFVSYTRLTFTLDWLAFTQLSGQAKAPPDEKNLRHLATSLTNHVLEAYRHATNTPWIRRITATQLYNLEAYVTYTNGEVQGIASIGPPPGHQITCPRKLLQDTEREFRQNVNFPNPPPVWDTLWLDAEDALTRGDYRSAVISAHSAIETLAHATILAWLREQSPDLDNAISIVAGRPNDQNRFKNQLSFEELTEFLNDTRKVEIALYNVFQFDPASGFDLNARFERLAAARNRVLHSGQVITQDAADRYLNLTRLLRQLFTSKDNLDRIHKSKADPAAVLTFLLDRPPHPRLTELLSDLQSESFEPTIYSMHALPWPTHRATTTVSTLAQWPTFRIYLPKRNQLKQKDWELQLINVLLKANIVHKEGWPYADIVDPDTGASLSLDVINWEAYRAVAKDITDVVLAVELHRRLQGTDLDSRRQALMKRQIGQLQRDIRSPDFNASTSNDLAHITLPIAVLGLNLINPQGAANVLAQFRNRAPEQATILTKVLDSLTKSGYETPQKAATAMLVIKNALGLYDAVGVREAPRRQFRSKYTPDELQRLGRTCPPSTTT
jgi:hypothetical protein